MCGIAGTYGFTNHGLIKRMRKSIFHRGPDSGGEVHLEEHRISLCMQRLAIIDIGNGDQPIRSKDGRVHMVYNGEVYNFKILREELRGLGHSFKTQSDTEVVLHSYLEWGDKAWEKLHGMFAIAIADLRGNRATLKLVRDKVGIKPLYFSLCGDKLVFASEVKAILHWNNVSIGLNHNAVNSYLRYRHVSDDMTMFDSIKKLLPGQQLVAQSNNFEVFPWNSSKTLFDFNGLSDDDAIGKFGKAIKGAVSNHMVGEVPIGAFLSGGIDSSLLVSLMASIAPSKVRTFSLGFPGFPSDDVSQAAKTAKIFNTNHTEIECLAEDFASLPDLVWAMEEPVGDPIVVPIGVLSREASKSVKVVLTGDGADEIFGGYLFQRKIALLKRLKKILPKAAWKPMAQIMSVIPVFLLDQLFDYPGSLGTDGRMRVAELLKLNVDDGVAGLFFESISLFNKTEFSNKSGNEQLIDNRSNNFQAETSTVSQIEELQKLGWLPDLMLNKTDKITMSNSLECRVPFLDHSLIGLSEGLGDHFKLRGGINKWIVREFGKSILPTDLALAPKRPFYAPLAPFRNSKAFKDLYDWALCKNRLQARGLFSFEYCNQLKQNQNHAGFLAEKKLFAIVMLECWFEKFMPDASWN